MKEKLILASTVTLGMLLSFVFFVFFLIAYWAGTIDFRILIGLTLFTNLILWLVSPILTDWMQQLFYKLKAVSFEEFCRDHPELASFMQSVCERHGFRVPRLRVISDANPTAYCYGSYPANARLVVSHGIFKYLDVEEQKAVVAHELGHIANWDFAVMTIAVTLLQVLYEIYYAFLRKEKRSSDDKKKGDVTPYIGAISYVLYLIGSYLVLYLSRTREYLADRFSAEETQNPDVLSMALVKIAYGIAAEADSDSTERLLASTRALGIYDFKAAHSVGSSFFQIRNKNADDQARDLTRIFIFDLFSPWATLAELNSTHPLTGKRIQALSHSAKELGRSSRFDFDAVRREGAGLDQKRLYGDFFIGLGVCALPVVSIFLALIFLAALPAHYPLAVALFGMGFLLQGLYKYRRPGGMAEETTVLELMQDPYANPLRGRFVKLEGKVVGKADAGSHLGEDVTLQDGSGGLIYLNYESALPLLGNLIFALGQAKKIMGKAVKATGWFRRSSYQVVDLDRVEVEGNTIQSYTRFWEIFSGGLILLISLILWLRQLY